MEGIEEARRIFVDGDLSWDGDGECAQLQCVFAYIEPGPWNDTNLIECQRTHLILRDILLILSWCMCSPQISKHGVAEVMASCSWTTTRANLPFSSQEPVPISSQSYCSSRP